MQSSAHWPAQPACVLNDGGRGNPAGAVPPLPLQLLVQGGAELSVGD